MVMPGARVPRAPTYLASTIAERVFAYMAAENTDLGHRRWSADHGGLLEPRPLQRATQSSQGLSSGLPRHGGRRGVSWSVGSPSLVHPHGQAPD